MRSLDSMCASSHTLHHNPETLRGANARTTPNDGTTTVKTAVYIEPAPGDPTRSSSGSARPYCQMRPPPLTWLTWTQNAWRQPGKEASQSRTLGTSPADRFRSSLGDCFDFDLRSQDLAGS
jgi:hypothetical protein